MGQLSVVLSGICAFTPGSPPLTGGNIGNDLLVVLPEGRTARASTQVPNATIPAHQPFIAFPTSAVNTSLTTRAASQTAGGFSIVFLDRELVDITPASSQALGFNQVGITPPQTRPDTGEENDVFWIADMRRIWPEVASIRSDCRPGSLPVSSDVVAQARLSGGTVSSALLPAQDVSAFVPEKEDEVRQTLAAFVTVTMPLATSVTAAELELTSIDDGDGTGLIVLNIPTSGTVEVRIGNMPTADINAWFGASHTPQHETVDIDFELYYSILPEPPDSELPLPVQQNEGLIKNCYALMTE